MQNRKHRAFQELQFHVWSFGYLTGTNRTERLQGLLPVIEIYLMLIGIWPEFVSQNSIKELTKLSTPLYYVFL